MKTYRIIVNGKVQKVGYREKVKAIAERLGIVGYSRNLETGSVEIVAQHGNEQRLRQFKEQIKLKDGLIEVKDISLDELDSSTAYKTFSLIRQDAIEELSKSMDKAVNYLGELVGEVRTGFKAMGAKQDETLVELRGFRQETAERQDKMLEKQDETLTELRGFKSEALTELRGLRGDFKDYIRVEFAEMKGEISHIKQELAEVKRKISMRN